MGRGWAGHSNADGLATERPMHRTPVVILPAGKVDAPPMGRFDTSRRAVIPDGARWPVFPTIAPHTTRKLAFGENFAQRAWRPVSPRSHSRCRSLISSQIPPSCEPSRCVLIFGETILYRVQTWERVFMSKRDQETRIAGFSLESFLPYRLAVVTDHVSRVFAARFGPSFDLTIAEIGRAHV